MNVTIKIYLRSTSFNFPSNSKKQINYSRPFDILFIKDQSLPWNKSTIFEEIESFGILAGEDNGNKVYVGRVIDKDGNFVPAKIIPALKSSFYVYNDEEEESDQFDFLDHCNDFHWVRSADANLDEAAEISGQCIGRGTYNGNVIVGRIDSSSKKLIGAYDGKAFELPSYDVLIYKSKGNKTL